MEKIAELPAHKMYKRDFNAGAKNCRLYISEIGANAVSRFYNDKAAQCTKGSADRVLSYWAGYQFVLKELENANTSASEPTHL